MNDCELVQTETVLRYHFIFSFIINCGCGQSDIGCFKSVGCVQYTIAMGRSGPMVYDFVFDSLTVCDPLCTVFSVLGCALGRVNPAQPGPMF